MYVLIEHYLKQKGKSYFSPWIKKAQARLETFEGFLSVEQLHENENPNRNLILLKFDSVENLKRWADSDDHRQLIEELSPFMERKHNSQLFKILL